MNNELASTRYAIWLGSSTNIRLLQEKQIKDKQVIDFDEVEKMLESIDEVAEAIKADLAKDFSLTDRQIQCITDYTINGHIAALAGVVHATKELETMQRNIEDETVELLEAKVKEFMDKPETEVAGIYLQQVINKINEKGE